MKFWSDLCCTRFPRKKGWIKIQSAWPPCFVEKIIEILRSCAKLLAPNKCPASWNIMRFREDSGNPQILIFDFTPCLAVRCIFKARIPLEVLEGHEKWTVLNNSRLLWIAAEYKRVSVTKETRRKIMEIVRLVMQVRSDTDNWNQQWEKIQKIILNLGSNKLEYDQGNGVYKHEGCV